MLNNTMLISRTDDRMDASTRLNWIDRKMYVTHQDQPMTHDYAVAVYLLPAAAVVLGFFVWLARCESYKAGMHDLGDFLVAAAAALCGLALVASVLARSGIADPRFAIGLAVGCEAAVLISALWIDVNAVLRQDDAARRVPRCSLNILVPGGIEGDGGGTTTAVAWPRSTRPTSLLRSRPKTGRPMKSCREPRGPGCGVRRRGTRYRRWIERQRGRAGGCRVPWLRGCAGTALIAYGPIAPTVAVSPSTTVGGVASATT